MLTSHATILKVYYDDRRLLSAIISPVEFQPSLFSHTGVCLIVVIFWNVNRLLLFLTKYLDLAHGYKLLKGDSTNTALHSDQNWDSKATDVSRVSIQWSEFETNIWEEVWNKTSCLQTSKKKTLKKKQKFAHLQEKHEDKSCGTVFYWESCVHSLLSADWPCFTPYCITHVSWMFSTSELFKKGISISLEVHQLFENLLKRA